MRPAFVAGHSSARMENRQESRTVSSDPGRSARSTPSILPPIRSMAARERVLRTSVRSETRCTPHTSKACPSISNLASVLTGLRCAEPASQV